MKNRKKKIINGGCMSKKSFDKFAYKGSIYDLEIYKISYSQ